MGNPGVLTSITPALSLSAGSVVGAISTSVPVM
jgi:hypothetical protein